MARFNVEDSLWTDPQQRFTKFCIRVGDEEKALGAWCLAVKLAQRYWFPEKLPIPDAEWSKSPSREFLVEVGLAERVDGGVYLKGSEEEFAWLFQKKEAGAASGEKRKNRAKDESNGRQRTLTPVERTSTHANVREPLSSSLSSHISNTKELKANEIPVRHDVSIFIACYVKAYQKRYPETRPYLGGKTQGQIKRFLEETPLERACELIQVYCQLEGHRNWFVTKGHDFSTFIENLNPISQALDTGRKPGQEAPTDYAALLGGEESA